LMESSHGEDFAVRRKVDRRDDGRPRVHGWVRRIIAGLSVLRSVIGGPFRNPALDQLDLNLRGRGLTLGHLGLAVLWRDLFDQVALVRLLGDDRGFHRFSAGEQPVKDGHDIAASRLRRLMAALAMRLKNRPDLLVITYRLSLLAALRLLGSHTGFYGEHRRDQ